MKRCTKPKAKTMKKYLAKFAVLACVACFVLSGQSQAANVQVHLNVGKGKVAHVVKHCHKAKHHPRMNKHRHCCRHARMDRHRRPVARVRKECCRHGH